MKRMSPGVRLGVVAAVLVALLAGLVYLVVPSGPAMMTVSAEFQSSAGLYVGNSVDILGMPVGHVTSIKAGPSYVVVRLSLPKSTPVPADARAVIMAPNVVNDRYVQLTPVYSSGKTLASGAVIPVSRTALPVSVDEIITSLDSLAKALGPNGANAGGSLSDLFHSLARTFGGNGQAVNDTLTSLGQAIGALSQDPQDLTALFDNLGNFTKVASQYTGSYQSFATDLATVSTDLSGDNSDLAGALSNLQQALGALSTFIQQNASTLGASVKNLGAFAGAISAQQQALGATFANLPKALVNLSAAFDPNAPGGPALRARVSAQGGSAAYAKSVCGSPLLRLLLLVPNIAQTPDPAKDETIDLACGVNGVFASLPVPAGASSGPDLSLRAVMGESK